MHSSIVTMQEPQYYYRGLLDNLLYKYEKGKAKLKNYSAHKVYMVL